jgi:hypothetical protein
MPGFNAEETDEAQEAEEAKKEDSTWRGKKSPADDIGSSLASSEPRPYKAPAKKGTATAPDPWTELAKQLVGQLQQEQAPIEAAISGALVGPAAQGAQQIAEEATGISPSSATGQWMSQQVAKGAQEADPLMEALSAYGSAYGAGQVGVDQALVNMGKANDAAVNNAGADVWLNALASHVGTTGSGYYSVPANIAKELPDPVLEALQGAGFGGISTPKGGWPGGNNAPSSVAAGLTGLGSTSPGTVPTYQSVTTPGNASNPAG